MRHVPESDTRGVPHEVEKEPRQEGGLLRDMPRQVEGEAGDGCGGGGGGGVLELGGLC